MNGHQVVSTLSILYEDEACVVVDKPSGLHSVTIRDGGPSLAELLVARFPALAEVGGRTGEAGLVHRLDQETSGAIVAAKTQRAWETLREALQDGKITKSYLALVEGLLAEPRRVSSFIGSRYRGSKAVSVWSTKPRSARGALFGVTQFDPLGHENDQTLVRAFAPVARRHQVRAHAAHIGHPLVGDSLYGSERVLDFSSPGVETKFFLHCEEIAFLSPSGTSVEVRAPAPSYALRSVRKLSTEMPSQ